MDYVLTLNIERKGDGNKIHSVGLYQDNGSLGMWQVPEGKLDQGQVWGHLSISSKSCSQWLKATCTSHLTCRSRAHVPFRGNSSP